MLFADQPSTRLPPEALATTRWIVTVETTTPGGHWGAQAAWKILGQSPPRPRLQLRQVDPLQEVTD